MTDVGYLSVPVFAVVLIAEAVASCREHDGAYEIRDTATNLFLGFVSVMAALLFKALALLFFQWVYRFRLFHLENTVTVWIAAAFACDFVFYFFHWLGHVCRLFWASHVVHHSSRYYNYSVAVRNHFLHLTYRFFFWSPLCLLGFDPWMIVFIDNSISLYQFLLHTQRIKKLGFLEWFLNTPSHHRVHHACNKKYIDKNFGGFLILYDRLFGTFSAEDEAPVFGITKSPKSNHPVTIVFHEFAALIADTRRVHSLTAKLKILFSNPSTAGQQQSELHSNHKRSDSFRLPGDIAGSLLRPHNKVSLHPHRPGCT